MELNQAMKLVLELAQQGVICDPEMQKEYQRQMLAIKTVEAFVDDSLGDNPSPLEVQIASDSEGVTFAVTNVPALVTLNYADGSTKTMKSACMPLAFKKGAT